MKGALLPGIMATFNVNDLVLLRYGNGTQLVRVLSLTPRGGMRIARFQGFGKYGSLGAFSPTGAVLKPTDSRILGLAEESDPRTSAARRQMTAPSTDEQKPVQS